MPAETTEFGRTVAQAAFVFAAGALTLGLYLLARALRAYRLMTGIESIGTSRIATAAAGEVRLTGTVSSASPALTSPLSGSQCVYYRASIATSAEGASGAAYRIETGSVPFVLEDGSGTVTVFTRDATWDLPDAGSEREIVVPIGATVTLVGSVLPYGELDEVFAEDAGDPVVAAELAAAREAGQLAASSEEAWGNAAIPGFGIGKPLRAPVLDPEARPIPVARPLARPPGSHHTNGVDLDPRALVVAAGPGHPLLISVGTPVQAVRRADSQYALTIFAVALTIVAAAAIAWLLATGTFPPPPAAT